MEYFCLHAFKQKLLEECKEFIIQLGHNDLRLKYTLLRKLVAAVVVYQIMDSRSMCPGSTCLCKCYVHP